MERELGEPRLLHGWGRTSPTMAHVIDAHTPDDVVRAGEATRGLGVSKPTISRHLKTLEEAGVVAGVIDGRTHRLTLRHETLAETSVG